MKVIGVGPGDPELITLRAIKELEKAEVVYVPKSTSSEHSLVKRIVERYTQGEVIELEIKMGDADYEKIARSLRENGVYAVLGDPGLYSTFGKLKKYVNTSVTYIPGVSAVLSCPSRVGEVLAVENQAIAIIPAARSELLERAMELFDVVIIVKANRNLDLINRVIAGRKALAARRCFMSEESYANRVGWTDYFTTVYIWP